MYRPVVVFNILAKLCPTLPILLLCEVLYIGAEIFCTIKNESENIISASGRGQPVVPLEPEVPFWLTMLIVPIMLE